MGIHILKFISEFIKFDSHIMINLQTSYKFRIMYDDKKIAMNYFQYMISSAIYIISFKKF